MLANSQYLYFQKGRMIDSIQKTKLITKLIKIISEKEKTIEKYKRSAKHQEKELKMSQNNQLNLFDEKLKEDINTTNLEVRAIQAKMQFMENRIEELTQVLNEEVAINTLYEDKIKTLQTNEQQFQEQIQLLEEDLQQQKQKHMALTQQIATLTIENQRLQQKIQEFSIHVQYEKILENKMEGLAKELLEYQKLEQKVGENIDSIYVKFCQNPLKRSVKQIKPKGVALRVEDLNAKLEQIEMVLRENFNLDGDDVLNETLDGISIIMKSFEEKLGDVACFTERGRDQEGSSSWKYTNSGTKPSKYDDQSLKLLTFEQRSKVNGSI